ALPIYTGRWRRPPRRRPPARGPEARARSPWADEACSWLSSSWRPPGAWVSDPQRPVQTAASHRGPASPAVRDAPRVLGNRRTACMLAARRRRTARLVGGARRGLRLAHGAGRRRPLRPLAAYVARRTPYRVG